MKIFYKKDFQRVAVELDKLKKEYEELSNKYKNKDYKFLEEKCKYEDLYLKEKKLNDEQAEEIIVLRGKLRTLSSSKGGYIKKINKLEIDLQETKKQLYEATKELSKRYIVKTVRETKSKKQVMGVKSSSKNSGVIKMVKERL